MTKEKIVSLGEYKYYKETGIKLNNFQEKIEKIEKEINETKKEKKERLRRERQEADRVASYELSQKNGGGGTADAGLFIWGFIILLFVLTTFS